MRTFLKESKTFAGIAFQGMYTMNIDDFFLMYEYYKDTGINLLDDYSNMFYLIDPDWNYHYRLSNQKFFIQEIQEIIQKHKKSYLRLKQSKINGLCLHEYFTKLKEARKYLFKNKTDQKIPREKTLREIAGIHISKKSIRNQVFKLHGEKCLCCGSTENLQIDHVISVENGGKNDVSNYQPLCKSCNVRKGSKNIDYRKTNKKEK